MRYRFAVPLALLTAIAAYSLTTTVTSSSEPPNPPPPVTASTVSATPPYLVAGIIRDRSASTDTNRTDELRPDQIEMLISRVKLSGGQLAYGDVDDASINPLARLATAPPPIRPLLPELSRNLLSASRARHEHELKEATYFDAQRTWTRTTNARTNAFRAEVIARASSPRTARRTNYGRMLERFATFFGEPVPTGSVQPIYVLLVLGDGEDNVTGHVPPLLPHRPLVVIVNGYGSRGLLSQYSPVVFESTEPAINYIVNLNTDGGSK